MMTTTTASWNNGKRMTRWIGAAINLISDMADLPDYPRQTRPHKDRRRRCSPCRRPRIHVRNSQSPDPRKRSHHSSPNARGRQNWSGNTVLYQRICAIRQAINAYPPLLFGRQRPFSGKASAATWSDRGAEQKIHEDLFLRCEHV